MDGGLWGPDFEIISDMEAQNSEGPYGLLEIRTRGIHWNFPHKESLLHNLQLIYGIGAATAAGLKRAGYRTISDLVGHPRWGKGAKVILQAIATDDTDRLARFGAADMELLGFYHPETIRFIDIETTGLYHLQPIFLTGVLYFRNGEGRIRQMLARNYEEERAILRETISEIDGARVIASYNGRSFDLPYLQSRLNYHRLNSLAVDRHFDLLRSTRRAYRERLPNCRLITVEKYLLQQERENDLPGALVPEVYQQYLDTGDRRCLEPILRHNAEDLLSMAKLLHLLTA